MVILTFTNYIFTFYIFLLLFAISLFVMSSQEPSFSYENYNPKEKKTDIESWNVFNNNYPHSISISNFTHSVNPESIYEIKSGDNDEVLNPNFVLPKEPILEIGLRNIISFGINHGHIEGADSKIEIQDDTGNTREIPILT